MSLCTGAMLCLSVGSAGLAKAQNAITVTNLDDSGAGSLRDSVELGAANPLTPVQIDFAPELRGVIKLESTISLCESLHLSITGPGAGRIVLSGQKKVRILHACNLRHGDPGAPIDVTIAGLTLQDGSAEWGGAISTSASLTLRDVNFAGNAALEEGGAIANYGGTLDVLRCTFSGNTAGLDGGALFANNGTEAIRNSTFAGNTAARGGAIFEYGYRFSVLNSTIADNTGSVSGGGIFHTDVDLHTAEIKGTILAENRGGNCFSHSFYGKGIVSGGYNLSTDDTCLFEEAGDRNDVPAELDPAGLISHGGSTPTIALLPSSPAVDAIPLDRCTGINADPLMWDQRGAFRPAGSGCDMGAYELTSTLPFAVFDASVKQIRTPLVEYQFSAVFLPGIGSAPIDPIHQPVTLQVGDYIVKLAPYSFRAIQEGNQRYYEYEDYHTRPHGTMRIIPLGGDRFKFAGTLAGYPNPECWAPCVGPTDPRRRPGVSTYHLVLTIGESSGTAFEGHYERP